MKRILSLMLAALFVLLSFTACSNSGSDTSIEESPSLDITFDAHYDNISESSQRAFKSLCNAIINGDDEVIFNSAMTEEVNRFYYTSFPLNYLVASITQLGDGNGFKITYKNDLETHLKLVDDFTKKVEEIKKACNYSGVSKDRYVFNLYKYICENITIDQGVLTPYETIMNSSGSDQSISQMFEYLVLQGGGRASHLTNFDNSATVLSAVYFNNGWYIFYPALEIKNTGGKGLTCFAMSFERTAKQTGVDSFQYTDFVSVESDIFSSTDFDVLETAQSYTESEEKIIAQCNDTEFILPI